ncbi:MAG: peptide chain release factor N(5)-glutamine methyltransferase [Actinobacteria bacterium]|uniref:peptide chain release factor N(5)-glutamine methyltransferase n=1 Tax=freshwater metagenome TaxID=449393 RepID=A0A6J7XRT7_9ZZZZ|nr:peptide chain release factor N(5)-glutamine methyltransferase [Actinomycetota bacterium]MSX57911.1 peptide chain release factor N(5)-glutamine methyltransferase [Actinomycetota bacterium]
MDIKALLRDAKSQLAESQISQVDAEHLLAHVLGISRMDLHNPVLLETTLTAISDTDVIEEQFISLLDRRINHEPLQYLTGVAPFRYLALEVGPGVLVPRPESELLVDAVLAHIKNLPAPVSVIDLGAGSGALALAIATEAKDTRVIAVEKSPEAIYWLKKNVSVIAQNVRVVEGDVADVLPGIKCDVAIANPPYIPDAQALPRDVAGFEPHVALFGGPTGMELPKIFITAAARLLKSAGVLVIEHTENQGAAIASELTLDFESITLHDDLVGRPRWTSAVRR